MNWVRAAAIFVLWAHTSSIYFPLLAASLGENSGLTVGILSLESDRAFAKLEKRLERWLQDEAAFPLETFVFSMSPADISREFCWRLNARADAVLKDPQVASWTPKRIALQIGALNSLLQNAKSDSNRTLVLCRQRGLLARALLEDLSGEEVASRRTIAGAFRLEPLLPADLEWDWETQENVRASFASKISQAAASLAFPHKKSPAVPSDQGPREPAVFVSLDLDPKGDQVQLYLYFPFRRPIRVEWTRPLTLSEVLTSPARSTLPLDADAFFRTLRGEGFGDEMVIAPKVPTPVSEELPLSLRPEPQQKPVPEPPTKWYNKRTFWVVVGGVAAGAALLHVLTGNHDSDTTRGLSVQVR